MIVDNSLGILLGSSNTTNYATKDNQHFPLILCNATILVL